MTFGKIQGIDISHWNEVKDVDAVASICDFVYFKVSQGEWIDPDFKKNFNAFKGKTDRGLYPFLDYAQKDYAKGKDLEWGAKQADIVIDTLDGELPECPIWCDTENNEGDATWEKITTGPFGNLPRVLKVQMGFKLRWEEITKKIMGEYTRREFAIGMNNFVDGCLSIAAYPYEFMNTNGFVKDFGILSPTKFPSKNGYIDCTGAWKGNWTFWQYSSTGTIPGIKGLVDLNVYNGDEIDWSALIGKYLLTTYPVEVEDEINEVVLGQSIKALTVTNIRNGVGTSADQWYLNGRPATLLPKKSAAVLESKTDSKGNPWVRIGFNQWCALSYNGQKLLEII